MKTIVFYILIICAVSTAQSQVMHHNELELKYPVGEDLPDNIVLGINGRVFVYNGSTPLTDNAVNPEKTKDFALVVGGSQTVANPTDGGIVGRDLALGSSELYMDMPDYVFAEDYSLPTLEETKAYVQENKHLPGVIAQKELEEQGYFLVDRMLLAQLKNLEELALHIIEQEKQLKTQEDENKALKAKIKALIARAEQLKENKKS